MSYTPPPSPTATATNDPQLIGAVSNDTVDEAEQYDSDIDEIAPEKATSTPAHFDLVASLYKRRGGFGKNADINWKKRCFTLCGSVLCYYDEADVENFDPSKPRGRLNLAKEDTIAEMHTKQKSGSPTEFLLTVNIYVLGGKRKWGICCKDREEQLQWYNAIMQYDGKPAGESRDILPDWTSSESPRGPKIRKAKKGNKRAGSTKAPLSPLRPQNNNSSSLPEQSTTTVFSEDDFVPAEQPQLLPVEEETQIDVEVIASFVTLNMAAYFMRYGNVHIYWISIIISNLIVVNLLKRTASNHKALSTSATPSSGSNPSKKHQPKRKGQTRTNRQSFQKVRPAGSTYTRAPPKEGSAAADIAKEHGPTSVEAIRAYGSSPFDYNVSAKDAYWNVQASTFNLRVGPNYKKNRQKAPSGPALYDLISIDFVRAETTLKKASTGFTMPVIPGVTDVDTGHPHVPPMFVINTWLPLSDHGMFGKVTDAPSIICVKYFAITERTLKELKDIDNASPGVKLFAEWCRVAETDDEFRGRFKAMGLVDEIEKTNIPSFISSYNGKPALVTKSGTFMRHENYIEFSVNVHMWGFLARKSLVALTPKFPNFVLDVGFTIEARKDHELPEVLLGGCRLINVDPEKFPRDMGESVKGENAAKSIENTA